MKRILSKKNIFWDFDGVLVDSSVVREKGFRKVLEEFPKKEVDSLINYHRKNGGLSRYVKFHYFFSEIRGEKLKEEHLEKLANKFSAIMREELLHPEILIEDSIQFVKTNNKRFQMHIVSGSDGNELKFLCESLGIAKYFKTVEGSPTPKIELVKNLLEKFNYSTTETALIGDSINDYDAAQRNKIDFYGYNNEKLENKGAGYISSFSRI